DHAPAGGGRAGHRGARPGHPARQRGDQDRVVPGRTDHRQVGVGPLIQRAKLVDLRAGQPAAPPDQVIQPPPLRPLPAPVGVDVHAVTLIGYERAQPRPLTLALTWPGRGPATSEQGMAVAEVVTGEAVVLEVPCARFPSRLLALGLDMLIQVLLFAVLFSI